MERWFALLTEKQLRRGVHRSTKELEKAIRNYIQQHNNDPKPFIWHKAQIISSIPSPDFAKELQTQDTRFPCPLVQLQPFE